MRAILILLLTSGSALAAELPVSGDYCLDGLIVSPDGIALGDASCVAENPADSLGKVLVACHDETGGRPDWQMTVTMAEKAGTLVYSDDDGPATLQRCE